MKETVAGRWREALASYIKSTKPTEQESEDDIFRQQWLSNHPLQPHSSSSVRLPIFHRARQPAGLRESQRTALQLQWEKSARALLTEEKSQLVLSNEDLDGLWRMLFEHSQIAASDPNDTANQDSIKAPKMMTYHAFTTVASKLPFKFQTYFKPSLFLAFSRTKFDGSQPPQLPIDPFFNYVLRRASLVQERICISLYDKDNDGMLAETDLEKYLGDLVPTFPLLDVLEKDFMSFYLCGASRKFFFQLDHLRRGRISILEILLSPILAEFFELQQPDLSAALLLSNWFSSYSATKIYSQYVELDEDRNGMLSRHELEKFAKSRYNEEFIARIFETCQTFNGEMDYRTYLDFVLAVNDIHTEASLHYLFRVLDVHGRGYLDEGTISFYVKALSKKLLAPFNMNDFLNEVFDMVNPRQRDRITLKDLIMCGIGGTVMALLIDSQALLQNQNKD